MKLLTLLLLAPSLAGAVTLEAGVGIAHSVDIGDGVWQQQGVEHSTERLNSPALLVGITGRVIEHLDWHADYVYAGEISASCLCVDDAHYNPRTHVASAQGTIPFNGHGHTQGVMLTLEPHTTWRGFRFGFEAGPWLYWSTWHESRNDPVYPTEIDMSHITRPQLGAVAGVSIGQRDWKISYRYFYQRQQWNPFPALQQGTHLVTFEKSF